MIRGKLIGPSACLLLAVVALGCQGGVEEQVYELQENAALKEARGILERYAAGQPLGSESAGFEPLVARVREKHPQEADVLQQAFSEIKAQPASRASIAKKALEKLPAEPAEAPPK
jgi:hypothetical protein